MSPTIPLAQYIFTRLRQLGCHSIHGIPGDFTLHALDCLPKAKVNWIGNASELCSGYAADGYVRAATTARRSGVPNVTVPKVGALFTTYGVGELSAINAVAGAYSESSPVVHLVGYPSKKQRESGRLMHHMVHPGEFDVYAEVAQKFACARADMACEDAGEAAHRFDEALIQCVQQSKPIYANLPSDMVSRNVPRDWLDKELETSLPVTSETEVDKVVDTILDRIRCARKPMIIADGLSYPWDLVDEANEIAQLTEMRTYCFNAGKGVVNEDLPSWIGPLSAPTSYTTSTDLALLFGPLLSGTNTAAYTVIPDPGISISFNLDHVKVGDEITNISAKEVLKRLIERLRRDAYIANTSFLSTLPKANIPAVSPTPPHTNSPITQDALWHRFSSWLKPHDTLLLANGTPLIGGRELSLPSPCQVIASGIWCSIGSMLPCAQGVAAAKRDHNLPGRTILFEGDGSFQVTAQAISDIIRYRLDVTIFICNNKGYTYERMLHGERAEYNDVPDWRYVDAAMFFGAGRRKNKNARYSMWARKVETWGQLEEVLENEKLANGKGLKIVDIVMDPLDVPSSSRAGLKRASEALKAL